MLPLTNVRVVRIVRTVLAISGLTCLLWAGFLVAQPLLYSHAHAAALQQKLPGGGDTQVQWSPRKNEPIGRLEIPRLKFSQLVAEGDDDATLKAALGHLPDTPFPWQPGNSSFAGHRDGLFRPLRDVQLGDRLVFHSPRGTLEYRVRQTFIVDPTDVWVVKPSPVRMLTLVTCYPFTYIGHAPQRFVVQADPAPAAPAERP